MKGAPKVRLVDIADEAGVSVATVDRVINDREGVSRRTAARVKNAIKQLDYVPNMAAQGLSRRDGLVIHFVLPAGPSAFIQLLVQAIKRAQADYADFGVRFRITEVEALNPRALAEALMNVGDKASGVAFVALEHPLVRQSLEELRRRGVPAVSLVSDISNAPRLAFIGFDGVMAGRTAGYLMGRFLASREGQVVIVSGSLKYRSHQEREIGFRQVLEEDFPNLSVVDLKEGFNDHEKTYVKMMELHGAYPDLVGVYGVGAGNRGIARALEDLGRASDVIYIGHELTEHTRRALLSGAMDAVIAQSPEQQASLAIRILVKNSLGQPIAAEDGILPASIHLRENLL